jgi:hypothetical protein
MADPQTISPAIDDAYWFAYSKATIDKALAGRNDQAAKLQNLIAWLWTIYTASAAVGLSLGKANYSLLTTVLIALPSFILIFAYWSAVEAQSPVDVQFDPRSPTEIKESYIHAVDQKKKQLGSARLWSFVAGIFVAIALLAASFGKQSVSPEFGAVKKGGWVTVWGRGIACDVVAVSIFPKDSESTNIINPSVPCSTRGDFATQLDMKSQGKDLAGAKDLTVKIEWTDPKKVNHTMAHAVE